MSTPDLSVVLARTGCSASLAAPLSALAEGCADVAIEILIVGAEHELTSPTGRECVRKLTCPDSWLTPERWGAGAREATGRAIAFTTDQLIVGPGWARALLRALDAGPVGVGGPIALAPRADAATAAAHLARFSAFLPGGHREEHEVADVAGDNAAYDRVAVQHEADLLRAGFWEVEFHRRFAAAGRRLTMVPGALATLVGPVPTLPLASQRFAHAREFGAARVRDRRDSALRIVLFAPLVPMVLLARIRRRAAVDPEAHRRFPGAVPRLLLLTIAWAAGEAIGAIAGLRRTAHDTDGA